ncbi:MAG: 1-acyl-sn-glycerol-3-phosphate acyltransferase [Ruminococcaceae bacterium]|nr:1-acyl-sn-glycerol-3-phosphate acyltransferase [Oscillospiraceae bacterium]
MKIYSALKFSLSGLFRIIYNLSIHGAENVPEKGKYIVVSNHISLGDVIILAVSCKRQIHFMAKKELFKIPLLSQLIKALGAFPVDRKGSVLSALKTSVKHLEEEKIVGMFPQGTRCKAKSVSETEFKTGAAFCSYRAKAGIIPAFIKTQDQKFGYFKRCDVFFGEPIEFDSLSFSNGGHDEYELVTEKIKDTIFEMEKKAYGGKFNG